MNAPLFDLTCVRKHKAKAPALKTLHNPLMQEIFNSLAQRIQMLEAPPQKVLILGDAPHEISQLFPQADLTWVGWNGPVLVDREFLPFHNRFDLVLDFLWLHWIHDVPKALFEAQQCLRDGGVYLCVFFGGTSLSEMRSLLVQTDLEASQGAFTRISPMIPVNVASDLLLSLNFKNPVTDHQLLSLKIPSLEFLLTHLRRWGETHALTQKNPSFSRDSLKKIKLNFPSTTTINLIYLMGLKSL